MKDRNRKKRVFLIPLRSLVNFNPYSMEKVISYKEGSLKAIYKLIDDCLEDNLTPRLVIFDYLKNKEIEQITPTIFNDALTIVVNDLTLYLASSRVFRKTAVSAHDFFEKYEILNEGSSAAEEYFETITEHTKDPEVTTFSPFNGFTEVDITNMIRKLSEELSIAVKYFKVIRQPEGEPLKLSKTYNTPRVGFTSTLEKAEVIEDYFIKHFNPTDYLESSTIPEKDPKNLTKDEENSKEEDSKSE